jgi:mannosyltransferase
MSMLRSDLERPVARAAPAAGAAPPARALLERPAFVAAALAVILLVGLALRLLAVPDRSLWFDETFTWRMVEFPFVEMLERNCRDNNPPLYYALLWAWAGVFGTSVFALRALSVVAGTVAALGMYLFTGEAFRHEAKPGRTARQVEADARAGGLFVAALVALSVFQIRYAAEVRMYALGAALVAFSSWALLRALRAPRAGRWWALYGVLTVLFAYTHNYALFSIAAQGVFVLGLLLVRADWDLAVLVRTPAFWHALLAADLVVVGCLPWLPFFLRQRAQVQAHFWTAPVTKWNVFATCYQMFVEPEGGPHPQHMLLAGDLCAAGLLALVWRARAGAWCAFSSAVAPFVLSLLVSAFDTKVFGLRYFTFAHLFFLAGLGLLVFRLPWPRERAALAALVLVNFLWVDVGFWQKTEAAHRPGVRGAARFLDERRAAGEPVVVCSPLFYFSVQYHLADRSGCYVYDDGRGVVHFHGAAVMVPEDFVRTAQLQALDCRRVWVINMSGGYWGDHAVPVPKDWVVKSKQDFAEVFGLGKVTVVEYEKPGRS